ncbi:SmB [Symbiodinium natans]|uniref:SmB protein n=1 Tax=Symbiodinium natans TaxID=878477 RepID=A0A812V177_9DINO|nr:SmB [Symbiodinium natans]
MPRDNDALWLQNCDRSCTELLGFLRMRADFEAIDVKVLRAANEMNSWFWCPAAYRSLLFSQLTSEIKKLPHDESGRHHVSQAILVAEAAAQELVLKNISGILARSSSFAPWFHFGSLFHAVRAMFPEFLVLRGSATRQSSPAGRALREALSQHLGSDSPALGPMQVLAKQWPGHAFSSLERAALRFAEADFLRTTSAPGILGLGGSPSAAREEMEQLLHTGQRFLMQAYRQTKASAGTSGLTDMYGLFTLMGQAEIPVFELLDRLDSNVLEEIYLPDSVTHSVSPFYVHLLPTRNVESNHVRTFFELHCDKVFKDLVTEHRSLVRPLTVVEIGSHLGGCILWALTHLPEETRGLAVDAYAPAVAALRRTVEQNRLADRLAVLERFVCKGDRKFAATLRQTGKHLVQPAWGEVSDGEVTTSPAHQVECVSLQAVLEEMHVDQVDLLRIHVLGREFDALRSAEHFLQTGKIKTAAISIGQDSIGLEAMAQMLLRHGYTLQLHGFTNLDVLALFRSQQILPKSAQTMIARYPR